MGVDYQVRVWEGVCVVMGVDYQVSVGRECVMMGVDYQVRVWEDVLKRVGGDQHELPDVSERV